VRDFIGRHLDPASRLGEILFALIMALGFTGSVRLGLEDPDNRELFIDILGCNLAWAIVDSVMYLMAQLFERQRNAKMLREVRQMRTGPEALARIAEELNERFPLVENAPGVEQFHRWLLDLIRSRELPPAGLHASDVRGAVAVALLIVLSTLPLLVPFLVLTDPEIAVRASNTVALAMLFVLGSWWGREVGRDPWHMGASLTAIGFVLVLVTIALGG
jgi:VIT1/CCC1 family predicted Fe2+/Mn2+ transporter